MRNGIRIAIDLGEVRIGVARSDASGTLALPIKTIRRNFGQELVEIAQLIAEYEAIEVILGLPLLMSGKEGKNTADVRQWAQKLKAQCPTITVRLVDERLTSVSAHQTLTSVGLKHSKHKAIIDQQAAVLILEQALNQEKNTGVAPGECL